MNRRKSLSEEFLDENLGKAFSSEVFTEQTEQKLTKFKQSYWKALQPKGMLRASFSPAPMKGRSRSSTRDKGVASSSHSSDTFDGLTAKAMNFDADASITASEDVAIDVYDSSPEKHEEIQDEEENKKISPFIMFLSRYYAALYYLHSSSAFEIIVLLSGIIALFASDISVIALPLTFDTFADIAMASAAIVLFTDLVVCLHVRRGYAFSILSLMDLLAVVSIVIEIRWILSALTLILGDEGSELMSQRALSNLFNVLKQVAHGCRLANIPKILRIAFQLNARCFEPEGYVADMKTMKDYKLKKQMMQKAAELELNIPDTDDEKRNAPNRSNSDDMKAITAMDAADENGEEKENTEEKPAKMPGSSLIVTLDKVASPWIHEISTVVLEFMTARMVLMVLLINLSVALLTANPEPMQHELGLQILDRFSKTYGIDSPEFQDVLQEYIMSEKVFVPGSEGNAYKLGTMYSPDIPLIYLRVGGNIIDATTDFYSLNARRSDELSYTLVRGCQEPYMNNMYRDLIYFQYCPTIAVWDYKAAISRQALYELLETICVTVAMAIGMVMIGFDLNVLVLSPLDAVYGSIKDIIGGINWAALTQAVDDRAGEDDSELEGLDPHSKKVRKATRYIVMFGDIFVRAKPVLHEQLDIMKSKAAELDSRHGVDNDDLVDIVESVKKSVNPVVAAVKIVVDSVDAVAAPLVGDIDIFSTKNKEAEPEVPHRGFGIRRRRESTRLNDGERRESKFTFGRRRTMIENPDQTTGPPRRSSRLKFRRRSYNPVVVTDLPGMQSPFGDSEGASPRSQPPNEENLATVVEADPQNNRPDIENSLSTLDKALEFLRQTTPAHTPAHSP